MSGENHNSKRYMRPNVHCSTIYHSQDMKFLKILPKAEGKKKRKENNLKQTASKQGLKFLGILKSRGLMISKQSKSQVSNPSSMLAF